MAVHPRPDLGHRLGFTFLDIGRVASALQNLDGLGSKMIDEIGGEQALMQAIEFRRQ
ncbi:hypothetical protein [Mycobacterium tilburgii]|uniref:hypothetical protein n=1 Tax=Mycobacterium tilburgii TaxID=44467 RepID=UPI001642E235|nr:hypothetical protein [Mycobacterium tilburgii]